MRNSLSHKEHRHRPIKYSLRWYIETSLARCPQYAASLDQIRQRLRREFFERLGHKEPGHFET